MTDPSVSISVNEQWAKALTDERLAADLRRLATNVRFQSPDARAAELREAADRLTGTRPAQQTLVTMPDGRQLAFMHGSIHIRSSLGDTWAVPLEPSSKPHTPNTFYVGEW